MFKKITALLFCAVIASQLALTDCKAAATSGDHIRVGLESKFSAVDTIMFLSNSLVICVESNGEAVGSAILNSSSGFSVGWSNSYFVDTGFYTATYYEALAVSQSYTAAYPCIKDDGLWTVYMGPFSSKAEADAAASTIGGSARSLTSSRLVILYAGSGIAVIGDCQNGFPQFYNPAGLTEMPGKKYRGRIECGRYNTQKLTAVNVIDIEEYLYSVVPSEMPRTWNLEALKSQAVAARTYVYAHIGSHSAQGYDLCDSVNCQVYLGATNEAETTTFAVDSTRGIIAVYDGEPITASYFASSGGYTENSENVWSGTLPYLRAVPDPYETTGKVWSRTFTTSDFENALKSRGQSIGTVKKIKLAEISASGRVQKLVIEGSGGSYILTKEEIRTFFSGLSGGMLESRNFVIVNGVSASASSPLVISNGSTNISSLLSGLSVFLNGQVTVLGAGLYAMSATGLLPLNAQQVTSMESSGTTITFSGKGNGHGTGMSQHGANCLADAGYTYEQILKYYYTGITLVDSSSR